MYTQKTHTIAHELCVKLPRVRTRATFILTKVTKVTIIMIEKKSFSGGSMKSSYNKLAELRDETIYQVKKALEARRLHALIAKKKLDEGKDEKEVDQVEDLENALTLDDLLCALVKLYEIK